MDDVKIFNNFVDSVDCDTMIERLEHLCDINKVKIRDDGRIGLIDSDDPVFKGFVDSYYKKSLATLNDEFTVYGGYITTKYVEGVGLYTHAETGPGGETNALMYLNDDYEGGELTYTTPDNVLHSIKAKRGDMIYCPSWFPHGVNKVTKGVRYLFTISLLPQANIE